ncbi:MAG: M14 family metallopeptidase [Bacteroidales bacterium]|nr:M14 family metallopeptidase [Bacteroidales bacterium]
MKITKHFILPLILILLTTRALPQAPYGDYKAFSARIESLQGKYPGLCAVSVLTKTSGGKNVYAIAIGPGNRDNKPAIAILGGVEGQYIAGRELALGIAERLLEEAGNAETKALLAKITFYVLPDMSPDASEQFFSSLKYERTLNARATDDDRDFRTDEDPYEDLNNDGFITLVRISDPTGNYIESDEDKRVMVPADLSKGETGKYRIITEGIDNDRDEEFNEDGPGGVIFNRNFTYNFEEYGLNSGIHAVSEPETKAVADFLYDHFNIYMTMAFGPQDNLGQPMKAQERQSPAQSTGQAGSRGMGMQTGDRRLSSITKSDETINKLLSDRYHEITGVKGAPPSKSVPGNFMEWSYFHYGRYSFSTPAWWIQSEKIKNSEAAFLKYAERKELKDVFVEWTEIKHPDFPDKKAETGGLKPFAMIVPPADTLSYLVEANYKFIAAAAKMHPELEFTDLKVENAGENLFRITLKVHNKGVFATCAESGNNNMWTRIMRISLDLQSGQKLISGQKVQRIRRLEGNDSEEFSWLLSGKGSATINAGALNTGTISTSINLK